ncbi:ParA family protein [uncultured Desulfobacter sp.]|uniref:ParA family protein n=1 Tax=uncultured Desulfobacter sp. TaxID=240139 RepID=UPI002AAA79EF|nr:ParA family protein [uncultured Desulfobacter sp.]
MTKRIVFFNHKGGVSKTTSVYNLGWILSKNNRVLVVDADPQCNLSSLILGENFEKYYIDEETKEQNIKDGVKVAFEGKPVPIKEISCQSIERAPNLFLLAGHANLSEYESSLTFALTSSRSLATLQNLPGAFAELLRLTEEKYNIDFTLIDLNPSLSAINQNFFIISNGFIVPTNPDPFSIMALNTLKNILPKWFDWKTSTLEAFKEAAYPIPESTPYFLGTIIQRFNIRRGKAAAPYRNNIEEIKAITKDRLFPALNNASMVLPIEKYESANIKNENGFCMQEISDFQSLLPKSYEAGVPVYELTDAELDATGPVLAQLQERREAFNALFSELAEQVKKILKDA